MGREYMLGIYFSGTGNTKFCVETFVRQYEARSSVFPIEDEKALEQINAHDMIVLGYPVYFSNIPKIVRDFINFNGVSFHGKQIFIIATMGLFSGDGSGCAARLLKRFHAKIIGGLHLKMPDCIGDERVLKKTKEANRAIIAKASEKIADSVHLLKEGVPTRDGLGFPSHIAGLLGQRLWFYRKAATYKNAPNVNTQKCIGCGRCAELCPMKNIVLNKGKAVSGNRCTLCYRCFGHCPVKALTILGKAVYEQCLFENYQ